MSPSGPCWFRIRLEEEDIHSKHNAGVHTSICSSGLSYAFALVSLDDRPTYRHPLGLGGIVGRRQCPMKLTTCLTDNPQIIAPLMSVDLLLFDQAGQGALYTFMQRVSISLQDVKDELEMCGQLG